MAGYALSIFREFKNETMITLLLAGILSIPAIASEKNVTVEQLRGDVQVRYGIAEEWGSVDAGDSLRPEDTIMTGINAFAVLRLSDGTVCRLPAEAMVDGADFRSIDRPELLLRLAMEDMLSVPDRIEEERPVPQTTVLHGSPLGRTDVTVDQTEMPDARFRLNGARFLVEQDFTETAVLKIRETLRLYPTGDYRPEALMLAAESLEKLGLYEEAARYYRIIVEEDMPAPLRENARSRLEKIQEMKGE